jgi:hypothetical protein
MSSRLRFNICVMPESLAGNNFIQVLTELRLVALNTVK